MSKNTIKIDGARLKGLLEYYAKKSLYEISEDEGFSRNFLSQACRSGKASPIVQSVARNYGVEPEQYKLKDNELKQMTIEEIDPNLVPRKKLDEALEQSANAIDNLNSAVCNCTNDIEKAFNKLKEEWKKALDMYTENIRRLREGK